MRNCFGHITELECGERQSRAGVEPCSAVHQECLLMSALEGAYGVCGTPKSECSSPERALGEDFGPWVLGSDGDFECPRRMRQRSLGFALLKGEL